MTFVYLQNVMCVTFVYLGSNVCDLCVLAGSGTSGWAWRCRRTPGLVEPRWLSSAPAPQGTRAPPARYVLHRVYHRVCTAQGVPQGVYCTGCTTGCVLHGVYHRVCTARGVPQGVYCMGCTTGYVLHRVYHRVRTGVPQCTLVKYVLHRVNHRVCTAQGVPQGMLVK